METSEVTHTVSIGNRIDTQPSAYREGIGAIDTKVLNPAFFTAVPTKIVRGRPNLPIHAAFSAASQSATVRLVGLVRDSKDNIVSMKVSPTFTLTATDIQDPDNAYLSEVKSQDSYGCYEVCLLVTVKASSGTFDLYIGGY